MYLNLHMTSLMYDQAHKALIELRILLRAYIYCSHFKIPLCLIR